MNEKARYLIVVDMQKDFVSGPLGSAEARAAVPLIEAKIKSGDYDDIFFTFDTHFSDYDNTLEGKKLPVKHCIKGTDGWNSALDHTGFNAHNTVEKYTFGFTGWASKLPCEENIESIEIVGVCTDICVVSNALIIKAQFPNTRISVDAACCAGTSPEAHKAALTVMKSCHIDVINE